MLFHDPLTLAVIVVAVVLVGLAKGGFAGFGALATPLLATVLPPAQAAALLLPILIAQDVIGVWNFRRDWDRWIVAWMLPSTLLGLWLIRRVESARFYAIVYWLMIALGVRLMWQGLEG